MEKNKLVSTLEREYKNKKIEKERNADRAALELIDTFPDFAALDTALRSAEIAAARKSANGENAKKEIAALEAAKKARSAWLKTHNISEDIFLPRYDCSMCRDTGVNDNKYCSCFVKQLNERLAVGGVPDVNTFADSNLAKIENKQQRERLTKIYASMQAFCAKFPFVDKKNIALIGKTGTGKTFLLSAMVSELERRGFSVLFLTAFALNNLLRKYHTTFDEDKEVYFDSLLSCDVLAIDDLGSEPIYKNITREYLYSLINERNVLNKCTLFSTNFFPAELKSRYEDRITFRLLDKKRSTVIEFIGDDLRSGI